jgi:hypothetical protein
MSKRSLKTIGLTVVLLATIAFVGINAANAKGEQGEYLPGDFHQHTYYTDGSHVFADSMDKNDLYGLQWWANSEHGGRRTQDGENHKWDDPVYHPGLDILGDPTFSGGHQYMYRWQSLRDFVYPDIMAARAQYPDKAIINGVEWNVPSREHCSSAIYQPGTDVPTAISEWEYRFDRSDPDTSRDGDPSVIPGMSPLSKSNSTLEDLYAAVEWMQALHDSGIADGWLVPAHIERGGNWYIENFREMKKLGPDVVLGMEGSPGHQASSSRGFSSSSYGGTFGGVGFYSAKVGGLWDALSAEGIKWFNYASSDDHSNWRVGGGDFWPGEYQKNYTYIDTNAADPIQAVFDGNRSGNVWFVAGDLIDELQFTAKSKKQTAMMGETLTVKAGDMVQIKIKVHDPNTPNHCPFDLDNMSLAQVGISQPCNMPELDHVDLIAGTIYGSSYQPATNLDNPKDPDVDWGNDAAVIETFERHGGPDKNGYMTYVINIKPESSMFIRLRGTNLPAGVPFETDADGNPLPDTEANNNIYSYSANPELQQTLVDALFEDEVITNNNTLDDVAEAYADLWFMSNPIYINVVE